LKQMRDITRLSEGLRAGLGSGNMYAMPTKPKRATTAKKPSKSKKTLDQTKALTKKAVKKAVKRAVNKAFRKAVRKAVKKAVKKAVRKGEKGLGIAPMAATEDQPTQDEAQTGQAILDQVS
jgi:hypothetical protein